MTAFQDQVDRALRQRLKANSLEYDRYIASVLTPQNASYCAVTLKDRAGTVIKIFGQLADDDESISRQIEEKVVSKITSARATT